MKEARMERARMPRKAQEGDDTEQEPFDFQALLELLTVLLTILQLVLGFFGGLPAK